MYEMHQWFRCKTENVGFQVLRGGLLKTFYLLGCNAIV
jgi:hypothetical protein